MLSKPLSIIAGWYAENSYFKNADKTPYPIALGIFL
jgi:hypothetical protein